ncbi:MAG TPA: nuclear transport factor 2 family protein [Gemmatimonadaceae bacterium]
MRFASVAIGFALLACAAAQAQAQQQRTPELDSIAVATLEREWLSAAHDSTTLNRVLASDFRHPLATGQIITKAQHIGWAASHPLANGQSSRFNRLDVSVFGNAAVADGSVVTTDRSGHEVARNVFSDVFVCRAGRWQAVHAQETEVVRRAAR